MSNRSKRRTFPSWLWHVICINFVLSDDASFALSVFYGIFVVNLTIVFVVAQYIASVGPLDISEYYLNVLFIISILWLVSFTVSVKYGKNRSDAKEPVKSYHASNKWLKGVVAIFGFSIIIKDALELFALTKITNPLCYHKALLILTPILHAPYVFGQVAFLFFFAKHHLQECRHFARFGIMHIMATNLSVWLATVAGEATEALAYEERVEEWFEQQSVDNSSATKPPEGSDYMSYSENDVIGVLFRGNCTCRSEHCKRVVQADKFLFPFLIEFCLISTCLLYVTWTKVGKKAKEVRHIFKPCYKFYKAYKGPTLGALVLASTVTVIILLGAFKPEEPTHERTYLTQYSLLHLYEAFLVICEVFNLLACIAGFYLYSRTGKQRIQSNGVSLDVVLLFVCFIGPLIAGMFSILSLSVGSDKTKAPGWGISLLYPIIDVIGTMVQILFIIFGMQHSPTPQLTSGISERDGTESKFAEEFSLHQLNLDEDQDSGNSQQENQYHQLALDSCPSDETEKIRSYASESFASTKTAQERNEQESKKNVVVERIRLADPDRTRSILREVLMFLVISNASLWIFLSLDKTVFSTLAYQYDYYGHGVWTTVTAITTPLSIFLHMHSSACFFEMWSYA